MPAPATPAAAEDRLFRLLGAKQAVQNRSIGTLAERAQAHYPPAHVQCTKSVQTVVLFNHSGEVTGMELALFQPDIVLSADTISRLNDGDVSRSRQHAGPPIWPKICTSNDPRHIIPAMTKEQIK